MSDDEATPPSRRRAPVRLPKGFRLPLPQGEKERLHALAYYALPSAHPESVFHKEPARPLSPQSRRTLVKMVRSFPNWRAEFRKKVRELCGGSAAGLNEALREVLADATRHIVLARPDGKKVVRQTPEQVLAAKSGDLIPPPETVAHFAPPQKRKG